jgi:hypothetical protein
MTTIKGSSYFNDAVLGATVRVLPVAGSVPENEVKQQLIEGPITIMTRDFCFFTNVATATEEKRNWDEIMLTAAFLPGDGVTAFADRGKNGVIVQITASWIVYNNSHTGKTYADLPGDLYKPVSGPADFQERD